MSLINFFIPSKGESSIIKTIESIQKQNYPNCKTFIPCKTFDDVFTKANENEDVRAIIPESNKTTGNMRFNPFKMG